MSTLRQTVGTSLTLDKNDERRIVTRPDFEEYRFLTIGYTSTDRLIIVAHTYRGDRIRIITARPVGSKERRFYEQ